MPRFNHLVNAVPRRLLTVAEVALLDNCSQKTVRRAIESGLLEVLRMGPTGDMIRIDPDAHKAYRNRFRDDH